MLTSIPENACDGCGRVVRQPHILAFGGRKPVTPANGASCECRGLSIAYNTRNGPPKPSGMRAYERKPRCRKLALLDAHRSEQGC